MFTKAEECAERLFECLSKALDETSSVISNEEKTQMEFMGSRDAPSETKGENTLLQISRVFSDKYNKAKVVIEQTKQIIDSLNQHYKVDMSINPDTVKIDKIGRSISKIGIENIIKKSFSDISSDILSSCSD